MRVVLRMSYFSRLCEHLGELPISLDHASIVYAPIYSGNGAFSDILELYRTIEEVLWIFYIRLI